MIAHLKSYFDTLDAEFDGKSWNGPSFMATLDKLSAAEALNSNTWEGYCAWELAIHVVKCKYLVARDLGETVPAWRFSEEGWFPLPAAKDDAAWAADRAYFPELHALCMKALRAMDEKTFTEGTMPTWKAPWASVIFWLSTHEAFHGAQMRSMGLPSLKEAKHP